VKERPSRRTRVQPQWKVEPMTTGQNDELQRLAAALPTEDELERLFDLIKPTTTSRVGAAVLGYVIRTAEGTFPKALERHRFIAAQLPTAGKLKKRRYELEGDPDRAKRFKSFVAGLPTVQELNDFEAAFPMLERLFLVRKSYPTMREWNRLIDSVEVVERMKEGTMPSAGERKKLAAALPTAETLKQLADLALTADELQQLPALKVIAKKRELALYGLDFEQYEARRSSWKELK